MTAGKVALFVLPSDDALDGDDVPPPAGGSPLADRDDDQLMLLVAGGLRAAFDALVLRHRRRVLRVAARYVRSPGLAHDVTQNTFLALYRAAPRYQPRGTFTSFLYRTLLNECRMVRRASVSHERLLTEVSVQPVEAIDHVTAEARILARERERRVQRALDRLSEKLRVIVVLRYSGDLSYQEIADVVDVPLGTVKRRLFDALDRLRELLVEES
jgi:RNA polymerase sigma-70 factor, ECF subfamily